MPKINDLLQGPKFGQPLGGPRFGQATGSFASRLAASQTSSSAPPSSEAIAASASGLVSNEENVAVTNASLSFDQKLAGRQLDRTFADFQSKEDPFAPVSANEIQAVMADVLASEPGSMPMKLLKLQIKMQREQAHFEFESNNAKSDHDGHKEIIENVR